MVISLLVEARKDHRGPGREPRRNTYGITSGRRFGALVAGAQ
jgi:hypothetical protein